MSATLLKRDYNTDVFLWILWNFYEYLFWGTSADGCFCNFEWNYYTTCCGIANYVGRVFFVKFNSILIIHYLELKHYVKSFSGIWISSVVL